MKKRLAAATLLLVLCLWLDFSYSAEVEEEDDYDDYEDEEEAEEEEAEEEDGNEVGAEAARRELEWTKDSPCPGT